MIELASSPTHPVRNAPHPGSQGERAVARGAFSEAEVRAILAAAEPDERPLIGVLALTGLRLGEAYATDWTCRAGSPRWRAPSPLACSVNNPRSYA